MVTEQQKYYRGFPWNSACDNNKVLQNKDNGLN